MFQFTDIDLMNRDICYIVQNNAMVSFLIMMLLIQEYPIYIIIVLIILI